MIRRFFHSTNFVNGTTTRVPLIKFLGKRANIKINTLKPVSGNSTRSTASASTSISSPTTSKPTPTPMNIKGSSIAGSGVDFRTLKGKAFYGRPSLSLKEMEEIDSGGASAF
jgi:hypothetical protein